MVKTYAVDCQACDGGFVDGQLCASCNGDEKIVVPEVKRGGIPRLIALVVLLALMGLSGYVLGGLIR